MSYTIKLHPKVEKFLNKLDNHIENMIRKRLNVLTDRPFHYLEHYEGENCYKFRAGDFRALIDVDETMKIVFVRVLDHRSRIYKKPKL